MKKILLIILAYPLISFGQSTPKVFYGSYQMDSLYSALNVKTDTTTYKPVVMGTNNQYHKLSYWPGGGSGTSGVNYITASRSYVGVTSGNGSTGTNGGTPTSYYNKNIFIGDSVGNAITTGQRNVGIGNYAMKIATITDGNVAIGDSVLLKQIQYGSGAVAIGQTALQEYTGATGMSPPVAIGKSALKNHTNPTTAASSNGAIGYKALELCTTCSENFAMGEQALGTITTANSNTAMGMFALRDATGASNTALGNRAGLNFSTGVGNTAIGASAGTTIVNTGGSNTMVGISATVAATGTAGGVAIGTTAKTGTNGVAIGNGASQAGGAQSINIGQSNIQTSGDYNVYLGYGASQTGATGSHNMVVRDFISVSSALTGSHNIIVGSDMSVPSASGSSQYVFGSNAIRWILSDVSGSARRTVINGSTTNVTATTTGAALEVKSTLGAFMPPVMTGIQATALQTAGAPDGGIIYVTSTDGVFTSVGFWGKIAGTWTALHL